MTSIQIPWATPSLFGNEELFVRNALQSTWISGGEYVDRLEKEISELCNIPFSLTTSNGTTALHLAYLALRLSPGDEIIVPGFGFLAAANVGLHMGLKPVFAEVDPDTWLIDPESILDCISPRTKAIVPVHTYGNVCEMKTIMEIASDHDIRVIEDAAESFASRYSGKMSGTIGTIGTFSFQATKTITTGEGGMVVTSQEELHDRMWLYRNHGMYRKVYYWHELPGLNFRLTNLQAAMGCAQMEHISTIIEERKRVHKKYLKCIDEIPKVTAQEFRPEVDPVLWAMAVRLQDAENTDIRDQIIRNMADAGIETRPGFYPPSRFSYFTTPPLPVSEEIGSSIISLPTYPFLPDETIESICSALSNLVK